MKTDVRLVPLYIMSNLFIDLYFINHFFNLKINLLATDKQFCVKYISNTSHWSLVTGQSVVDIRYIII